MKVEAYFTGIKNANDAVLALKNMGLKDAKADINDHYISNMHHAPRLPGTDTCPNLSSLVLDDENFKSVDDTSPIKAASPMVSGMGNFEEITDVNYKICVEVEDKDVKKAKSVIKNLGGEFKDPNLNIPNRIKI